MEQAPLRALGRKASRTFGSQRQAMEAPDGDTSDLAVPAKHSLRTRIQDILWDMGVDAFPNTHLVAKADAKDLAPETV